MSRPDPSGADQIDAEHQATDLAALPAVIQRAGRHGEDGILLGKV